MDEYWLNKWKSKHCFGTYVKGMYCINENDVVIDNNEMCSLKCPYY